MVVSFELGKLLKDKGFDEWTKTWHQRGEGVIGCVEGKRDFYNRKGNVYTSAPTIAEVVMWLYEKHGIWIELTMGKDHTGVWFDWDIFSTITPRKDDELGEEDVKYEDDPNEKWLSYKTTYSSMIDERFATMDKESCSSPTESYEVAIEYALNNLI